MPITHLSRPKPFSMLNRFVATLTCVLLLFNYCVPAAFASETVNSSSNAASSMQSHRTTPHLKLRSPKFGSTKSGGSVKISIAVAKEEDASTLKVKLNGHNIDSRLHSGSCTADACTMEGTASTEDGLKDGQNLLSVQVSNREKTLGDTQSAKFLYQMTASNDSSGTVEYYEPASVGISTVPNGGNGNTWINLTTGNQAGITDTSLQNIPGNPTVSVAYPDSSISINCSSLFQAVILDRTQPSATPETSTCANSEAEMESNVAANLGRPLNTGDLIVFGTTPGSYANNTSLDTSSIGGTNWGASGMNLSYYDIIGVKGAKPGTAHENYSIVPGSDTPNQYVSFLSGTLIQDKDANYNFIPSDERQIQVVSGAKPTLQVGGQSYQMPSNSAPGAFWVVVLDRYLLQPINYSAGNWTTCGYDQGSQACGGVFDVHADGGAALASMLSGVNSRNLIIIASQGCPFSNAGNVSGALASAIQNLGGAEYSLQQLNTTANTCAYSLVSGNLPNQSQSTLTGSVALSANQFNAQSQTGSIHGYLARGNNGLYTVAMKDQMLPGANEASPYPAVDYTFEATASSQRQDWPLTDTPGHLAAYHDISQQLMTDPQVGKTGSYIYDVRYFYTSIQDDTANHLTGIIDSRLDPTSNNVVTQSSWDTATPQEFSAAQAQIKNELTQLNSAMGYLTGADGSAGVRGLLNGPTDTILANAFAVASAIGQDQNSAASQTINANPANMLNLAAGITSLVGAVTAPLLPEVGIFFGVFSGALWTGSAADSPLSGTLPGPESPYDFQLQAIISDASTYSNSVLNGYDGAVDNIFSDPAKLATISALTSNSDSNWSISSLAKGDGLSAAIAGGEERSLWLQVLPGIYGIRSRTAGNYADPATFGSEWYPPRGSPICVSVYAGPLVPSSSRVSFPTFGNTSKFDTYFMALGPNPVQPAYYSTSVTDTAADTALTTLLTTSQSVTIGDGAQSGLNMPPMLFFTSPIFTYHAPLYFNVAHLCDEVGVGESPDSFSITGPSAGIVGQRAGSYTITAMNDGQPNLNFKGTAEVTLTGPGNLHLHRQVSFHGEPETVSFTAVYPEAGTYTLKVSFGPIDVSKQIRVRWLRRQRR